MDTGGGDSLSHHDRCAFFIGECFQPMLDWEGDSGAMTWQQQRFLAVDESVPVNP
jgi:hypothetical protein